MSLRTYAILSLVALLVACSPSADRGAAAVTVDTLPGAIVRTISHAAVDSGKWSLTLARTVGPAEGAPGELADPQDIALADDGTLYVFEGKPSQVKVFGRDGALLRTFGREGEGPGEFRAGYLALRGDTLLVQDPRATRATTFRGTDGTLLATKTTVCCNYGSIAVDGHGRVVLRTIVPSDSLHPTIAFARLSFDGAHLDTVHIPQRRVADRKRWIVMEGKNAKFEMQVPLQPRDVEGVDVHGGFVTGWSGEYLLRTTENGSDTTSLFGRDAHPEAMTAAMKQAIVDEVVERNKSFTDEALLRAAFKPDAIPDRRAAFDWLWTDRSGRRWVHVPTADTSHVTLDLFDPAGRWLDQLHPGTADWPAEGWAPVSFSRDEVAVLIDGADGRPAVKIYRIGRKP